MLRLAGKRQLCRILQGSLGFRAEEVPFLHLGHRSSGRAFTGQGEVPDELPTSEGQSLPWLSIHEVSLWLDPGHEYLV